MVAISSCTDRPPGHALAIREAPLRGVEPPAPAAARQREETTGDAPHINARLFTPFVAQVIAQMDGEEPPDPQAAAAAYMRATETRFEPLDILPPA